MVHFSGEAQLPKHHCVVCGQPDLGFSEKWEVLVDDRGDLNGDATSVIPIVGVFTHFLRIGSSPSASKKKLLLEHTWLAPFLLDMFVDGGC